MISPLLLVDRLRKADELVQLHAGGSRFDGCPRLCQTVRNRSGLSRRIQCGTGIQGNDIGRRCRFVIQGIQNDFPGFFRIGNLKIAAAYILMPKSSG